MSCVLVIVRNFESERELDDTCIAREDWEDIHAADQHFRSEIGEGNWNRHILS